MKEFQIPEGVQIHLNLFTLRHNFRIFPWGKRKGFSPVQLEGLNVSLNDWSNLLYLGDKANLEEALFLSGRTKEAIFSERALDKKKDVLIISSEVRSLAKEELKIRPEGGEEQIGH